MQITIRAIGRLKQGPERVLVDDYLKRASTTGRQLGLGPFEDVSLDNRSLSSRTAETQALLDKAPDQARIIAMDERGKQFTSPGFSNTLQSCRDDGISHLVFLIGGADGYDPALLPPKIQKISLGDMVWPHKLVRVMLAEQLYRAVSLLAGTPYHRE